MLQGGIFFLICNQNFPFCNLFSLFLLGEEAGSVSPHELATISSEKHPEAIAAQLPQYFTAHHAWQPASVPSDGSGLAQTHSVFPDLGIAVHTSPDLEAQLQKDANLSLWVCFPNLQLEESICDPRISVPVFENCCLEHLRLVQGPVLILSYL